MQVRFVLETINFEREGTPYKKLNIGITRFRPYPQMTPDEFKQWYKLEIEPYYDKEEGFDIIINNEMESDDELSDYWLSSGISPEPIDKLLPMREYFMDFSYSQKLGQ